MASMNDRQRVEASIIPFLIYCVCTPMVDLQETEEHKQNHKMVTSAAFKAVAEPCYHLTHERAGQIFRRVQRTYNSVSKVIVGTSNAQALMAIYYLLEGLLQEERISIYEDSQFGKSLQVYMEAIDRFFEDHKLDLAAQKRARQMRDVLRAEGYFK